MNAFPKQQFSYISARNSRCKKTNSAWIFTSHQPHTITLQRTGEGRGGIGGVAEDNV